MLKQRLLTALILAPLVLWGVLVMTNQTLMLVMAVAVLVGGHEWARLAGAVGWLARGLYLGVLALVMAGLAWLTAAPHQDCILWLMAANVLWWLVVLVRSVRFTAEPQWRGLSLAQLFEGVVVLVPAWLALVLIHRLPQDGPRLLVFLLLLIWSADIGAYFSGRRWGRVKLAPRVSPGKTREGVYGAMASAVLCGLVLAWWRHWGAAGYLYGVILCLMAALISILGDLLVSMLKRLRGVKDSGSLLPGHGGLLDRIDSLTAASPLFLFGLILWGETL
jgi:phosphatidate cytidylyltransferase